MKPLEHFPLAQRKAIKVVFTDIDDTLTTSGRLTAKAYASMEALQQNNLRVVPITGRPAGWCDHIARMWPVDGVIGENGAFYFRYDHVAKKMHRHYVDSNSVRARHKEKLSVLAEEILSTVKGAAISADQAYREADLAIDFCEDVKKLDDADVDHIVAMFHKAGASAKISSIHVNGWFGEYDKLSMTRIFAAQCLDMDLDSEKQSCVFVGDSPNDAPMFEFFPNSIGVANIHGFVDRLSTPPSYVTPSEAGEGFSEVAASLIQAH